MKVIKIIGSVYSGPEFKAKKFNVPTILVKPVKGVLEFCGYYIIQLTMENYKQKYEAAIEQAKKELKACGSLDCDAARQVFRLFPELKKSEDELMREGLIHFLETCQDTRFVGNRNRDKWIEWLKSNPIFDMPKIEFKVGDWVIFKCGTPESVYKVEKLENYEYTLEHFLGGSMPLPFGSQSLLRPWTIQDAKKGDILQANKCTLIFNSLAKDINGNTVISSWYYCDTKTFYGIGTCKPDLWDIEGVTPATTEQRNFLFTKMKGEGYKWDNNKKELIREDEQ